MLRKTTIPRIEVQGAPGAAISESPSKPFAGGDTLRPRGGANTSKLALALLALTTAVAHAGSGESDVTVLRRPLSKADAFNIALAHNGTILQARKEVEATAGVAIQLRAIVFPHVSHNGSYEVRQDSLIEANQDLSVPSVTANLPPPIGTVEVGGGKAAKINNQAWLSEVQVVQSLYEGGRMLSNVRSARLLKEQSLLVFDSTVADTLLSVSDAYDNVQRNIKQVEVREQQVTFLTAYHEDAVTRLHAGTVPEFEVLRTDVELSNGLAQRAQTLGLYRVSKQKFVELLGYDLPTSVGDDLSLKLTTPLRAAPYGRSLSAALADALLHRTEVLALEKEERIRDENIVVAKSGYKPSVQAFAGYQVASRVETREFGNEVHGGLMGVQMSWSLFDGFLTKGKIDEAVARRGKAAEAKAETMRQVELQVRNAWSDLRTARSVLQTQADNVKTAVRALELAEARYKEGAGTQIDVLSAQTALTDARGSYVDALRDYSVARAGLIRATGVDLPSSASH